MTNHLHPTIDSVWELINWFPPGYIPSPGKIRLEEVATALDVLSRFSNEYYFKEGKEYIERELRSMGYSEEANEIRYDT